MGVYECRDFQRSFFLEILNHTLSFAALDCYQLRILI